jgi:hypothetical protein
LCASQEGDVSKKKSKTSKDKRTERSAEDEIAWAEERLAKALRKVEKSRAKLMDREQTILAVLAKHNRLPQSDSIERQEPADTDAPTDVESVSTANLDNPPETNVTVPLLDQKQTISRIPAADKSESGEG